MSTTYSPLKDDYESSESLDSLSETNEEQEAISSRERNWKRFKPLITTLVLLITFSVAALLVLFKVQDKTRPSNSPVPDLPLHTVVFRNYSDFNNPPTPENDALWMDLLGPGMGFISIENPNKYGLPPGVQNPHAPDGTQNFGISMYHQLHCLMMIRGVYWEALRGERNLLMLGDDKLPADIHHTNHCFDYLRQAIMCAGDMSVEGRAPQDHILGGHVNGMGQKHICRNFDVSRAWMDDNLPWM